LLSFIYWCDFATIIFFSFVSFRNIYLFFFSMSFCGQSHYILFKITSLIRERLWAIFNKWEKNIIYDYIIVFLQKHYLEFDKVCDNFTFNLFSQTCCSGVYFNLPFWHDITQSLSRFVCVCVCLGTLFSY